VLLLLRGEDLELLSRQLGVTAAELSGWRGAFLAAGEVSLKTRPADARDALIGAGRVYLLTCLQVGATAYRSPKGCLSCLRIRSSIASPRSA
jgi:hypothetical protein